MLVVPVNRVVDTKRILKKFLMLSMFSVQIRPEAEAEAARPQRAAQGVELQGRGHRAARVRPQEPLVVTGNGLRPMLQFWAKIFEKYHHIFYI
jgi:hypothetical protein